MGIRIAIYDNAAWSIADDVTSLGNHCTKRLIATRNRLLTHALRRGHKDALLFCERSHGPCHRCTGPQTSTDTHENLPPTTRAHGRPRYFLCLLSSHVIDLLTPRLAQKSPTPKRECNR